MSKPMLLKIAGEPFDALRDDFDKALENLLIGMTEKGSEDGELSVKVEIALEEMQVPDEKSVDGMQRDAVAPSIKYKVVAKMTNKDERSGLCVQPKTCELVWDRSIHKYVLRGLASDQQSFFEDDDDELLGQLNDMIGED